MIEFVLDLLYGLGCIFFLLIGLFLIFCLIEGMCNGLEWLWSKLRK